VFEGHEYFGVVLVEFAVVHHGGEELGVLDLAVHVHVHVLEDEFDLLHVVVAHGGESRADFSETQHAVPVLVDLLEVLLQLLEVHFRTHHSQLGLDDLLELALFRLLVQKLFVAAQVEGGLRQFLREPLVVNDCLRSHSFLGVEFEATVDDIFGFG